MIYDLAQDAVAFLTDFSETVTYHPASGESRQIKAVVDRSPPADLPGAPAGALAPKATIAVANRATAISDDTIGGISTSELDTGGDMIALAVRIGQDPTQRPLKRVVNQDAGMITLEVR